MNFQKIKKVFENESVFLRSLLKKEFGNESEFYDNQFFS